MYTCNIHVNYQLFTCSSFSCVCLSVTQPMYLMYQPPTTSEPSPKQFSDDEEDTKRVVRSMKEKRYEELEAIIHSIRNHKKIKDFSSALASFEELQRAYTRASTVIMKEENGVAPRFFIRALVELDDWVVGAWADR